MSAGTPTDSTELRPVPSRVEPLNSAEMLLNWNTGESFALPYFELRFQCPCAGCVDEHTGRRTLSRDAVKTDVRAVGVNAVGRYALQVSWSDGHQTGMYHFENLHKICQQSGRRLTSAPAS